MFVSKINTAGRSAIQLVVLLGKWTIAESRERVSGSAIKLGYEGHVRVVENGFELCFGRSHWGIGKAIWNEANVNFKQLVCSLWCGS